MIEERESTGTEIAVIGMAGRFPGAIDIDEFWENLKSGRESIAFFTDDELEKAGVEPVLLKNSNYVKAKGMLGGSEYFDAYFFDYKPLEAQVMDPQVRLLLECVWNALEHAGYDPGGYHKLIGLYAGATANFFWKALTEMSGKSRMLGDVAAMFLTDKDFMATSVSYKLNLKGPAVVVQSACSTSLVAIHMACQGILDGECDMALAGGVTLAFPSKAGYLYQEGMITSPDGHCRPFDAYAKGIVSGDGVGVVLLKSPEDAEADGDTIHAVIKGSFINNDGNRKVGYTAPSVDGQAEAVKVALQVAEVEPGSISYIETHGTGTPLGDPVELEALTLAFNTQKKGFCSIGAVKSNVGHLGSAAGAAGFIKTVMALKHRLIPPSLHFKSPNPKIDFENSPFYVNTTLSEWKGNGGPLRAGVSSFGIGGTNAHVVLEEAPGGRGHGAVCSGDRRYRLLLLSAKTETALQKMTENFTGYLKKNPGINLADAAYTLQVGRKSFKHRRFLVCPTDGVEEAGDAFSSDSKEVKTYFVKEEDSPVVFMFAGQGSQYVNMGLDLYRTEKDFRETVDRCFEIIKPVMGYDLKEVLYPAGNGGVSDINRTSITQPIIFIFEYALAELLMKWGIKPHSMIGYSLGEYVSACVAGVLSLEDALELVALRGRLMQRVPEGAMLSVPLTEEQLKPLLNKDLSLAIINHPTCIVAGSTEAVEGFEKELKKKRLLPIRINAFHAAHSLLMDSVMGEFEEKVKTIKLNKPQIPYISNVSGTWISVEQATSPAYWVNQLRGTVRFSDGLEELLKTENAIFVEIGPGRVLGTFVRQHPDKKEDHKIMNLVRHPQEKVPDDHLFSSKIGQLWLYGKTIDWDGYYSRGEGRPGRIPLPAYPFEGKRFWMEGNPYTLAGQMAVGGVPFGKRTDRAEWFYIPSWKRSGLSSARDAAALSRCLVFTGDGQPLGGALVRRLMKDPAKTDVIVVRRDEDFGKDGPGRYRINPGRESDYDSLIDDLKQGGKIPTAIFHLWNVTGKGEEQPVLEGIDGALDVSFYSLFYLARALGRKNIKQDIRLLAVSDHMQGVLGEKVTAPVKALLLGVVGTIAREYSNIHCRSIDVEVPTAGAAEETAIIGGLLAEAAAANRDKFIAYRSGLRWVRAFESIRLEKSGAAGSNPRLKEKGVYLVTGGLGGIGLELAEQVARLVKPVLVLTGRTPMPERNQWDQWLGGHEENEPVSRKIRKIKSLEALGAEIAVFSADVSQYEQMQEVIGQVVQRFDKIDGVIHAAGLGDYGGVIQRRPPEKNRAVMASKVQGTLVLDALLKDRQLDFFVMCSSLASLLTPFGEVEYSAANSFMDAFARGKSTGEGLFVSINWDFWIEVGMGVVATAAREMEISPEDGLLSEEGKDAFMRILGEALPQVVVCTRDLGALVKQTDNTELPKEPLPVEDETKLGTPYQRPELDSAYAEPRNRFEQIFAGIFQEFLGIDKVGIDDNFFQLGASSLDIIHLAGRLSKQLEKDITPVIMFEYPTISSLAQFLELEEAGETVPVEETDRPEKINRGKDILKRIKRLHSK